MVFFSHSSYKQGSAEQSGKEKMPHIVKKDLWINDRNEDGFWIETDADGAWSFDWNVIGCRKDAKLEVEPYA